MLNKGLSDTYERLEKKKALHTKATKLWNFLIWVGMITFLLSIFGILPWILSNIFKSEIDNIEIGGFLLGLLLAIIGSLKIQKATETIDFHTEDEEFMKVYELIQDIELLQNEKTDFLKFEAAKKLSKVAKKIKEPELTSSSIWDWLAKEEIENLRLLKQNIEKILIPNIIQGSEEDIKKVNIFLEKFAENLLNPTSSELKDLNSSITILPRYIPEETPLFPFLKNPFMRHVCFVILFAVSGYIAYHSGISIGASIDTAYTVGIGLFGALTAGYMVFIGRNS